MRPSRAILGLASFAIAISVASTAEAANRRGIPRGFGGAGARDSFRVDDIVAAIVANAPAGATIVLPAGRYPTAVVLDRRVRLVGSAFGTTLEASNPGRPAITVARGVADVTIESLTILGGLPASFVAEGGNDRLALRGVLFDAAPGDGARIAGGDGIVVDRCTFQRAGGAGLDLGGRSVRATRLVFRPFGGPGLVLRGENVSVTDSSFEGGPQGVVFGGLRADVSRSAFRGVFVAARMGPDADACSFRRNDVRAASNAFVADVGSTLGVVEDNRIASTSGDAIRLLGTSHAVTGNVVAGSGGAGVVGTGTSLRVADNRFESPQGDGVVLTGDGNTVDSNAILTPGGVAVAIDGDRNVLAQNDCRGAQGDAIVLAGGANRLVDNTIVGAAAEGIRVAGDANTLQGNVVRETVGNGLHVEAGVANVLEKNRMSDCGGRGFLDEGVGTVLKMNRVD